MITNKEIESFGFVEDRELNGKIEFVRDDESTITADFEHQLFVIHNYHDEKLKHFIVFAGTLKDMSELKFILEATLLI